ncbi:MAG TPA: hypothetical protein PLG31_11690 [Spirochaetota bacterium]|nr:hypothetical protein [Spirochaetota bacterium]
MAETKVGEVFFDVTARVDQLEKGLAQARARLEDMGKAANKTKEGLIRSFTDIRMAADTAFRLIGEAYTRVIKPASALQETNQKFDVVFANVRKHAEDMARVLMTSYGASENAAKSMLSHTGDILTGFGFTQKAALDLSMQVQKLAVDLVSFTNYQGGVEEASRIITKALLGEREALEGLGKKITEDMLMNRARADGIKVVNGEIDAQAKAMLTLKILTEQSKNAIGDFARSANSFANTMRVIEARSEDFAAAVGMGMLPALSELGQKYLKTSGDAKEFGAAIGRVGGMLVRVRLADMTVTTAQVAYRANPLTILTSSAEDLIKGKNPFTETSRLLGDLRDSAKAVYADIKRFDQKLDVSKVPAAAEKTTAAIKRGIQLTDEQIKKMKAAADEWRRFLDEDADKGVSAIRNKYAKEKAEIDELLKGKFLAEKEHSEAVKALKRQEADEISKLTYQREQAFISSVQGALTTTTDLTSKMVSIRNDFNSGVLSEGEAAVLGSASIITSSLGQMNALAAQSAANRTAEIDQTTQAELESIAANYEAEKANIERTITDKEKRDAALKALDEKRARDEKMLRDRAEKEKRQIAHETAKKQREINRYETIISTATGAIQAYKAMSGIPMVGPALGAAAAAAITYFGNEKLKMIDEAPLPALARGALIEQRQGGTPVIVGEGRHDEAVIPLNAATFDMLGERMMAALMARAVNHSVMNTVTNIDNRATVERPREPIHIHNVIELDGEVISEFVTKATDDARILINPRAIK